MQSDTKESGRDRSKIRNRESGGVIRVAHI